MNLKKLRELLDAVEEFPVGHRLDALNEYLLPGRVRKLLDLIELQHEIINKAFEYDGDVFGIRHNDAVDALCTYDKLNQEDV